MDLAPPVPPDPLAALRVRHHADGLRLDAWTTCAEWLGERLDLGYALDVLHPLASAGGGSGFDRYARRRRAVRG